MKILKKSGTLRFWGDWSGRPYDNFHVPVSAELAENMLTILFKDGGKCVVYEPSGIVNEPEDFHVERASRVVWEWYYYGKEHIPENLCRREYTFIKEHVADFYALELC